MNILGVGPAIFVATAIPGAILFAIHYRYPSVFTVAAGPWWWMPAIGVVLWVAGIPFMAVAARQMMRARRADRLVTDGVYAWCRHPLYAAWALFIVPGAILFLRSWLLLAVPVIFYASVRVFSHREERQLEEHFGDEYRDYKRRVHALFPTRPRR